MPAIALVGAAASISAGVAAGGLLGGMMIAGGVMTGLGTLTGNKKLARIGAIVGLAGGIGTMISNASSAAGGLGQAVDATGGLETATNFGASDVAAATTGSGALDFSGAFATPVAPQGGIVASELGAPMSDGAFLGEFGDMAPATQASAAEAAPMVSPQASAVQQQIAQQSATTGITGPSINGQETQIASNPLGEAASKLQGWGKDAWGFVTNPKNAQLVKAGSGLVQGAMGAYSQQSMIDQQLAAREAERQRFNRSIIGQYVTR